jgi:hypothetical protein
MTQAEPVLIKSQIAKCARDGGAAAEPEGLRQTAAPARPKKRRNAF